jgi:hypothetical protein
MLTADLKNHSDLPIETDKEKRTFRKPEHITL